MANPDKNELISRINRVYQMLNTTDPEWDAAFFIDKLNQFYLTDTMQNGIFVLRKDGQYAYFVRNSLDLAKMQSPHENIMPMQSYKDLIGFVGAKCSRAYIETKIVTYEVLERLKKYIEIDEIRPVDPIIAKIRAVKSPFELSRMEESARQHCFILEEVVPGLLKEGMSEAELTSNLYVKMIEQGYQGVLRFAMFQTELIVGQLGFGESSLSPTCFDGAGGNLGICHAVATLGSRERKLKPGDLVFVDIAYGADGYHTDRTQLYMFKKTPDEEVIRIHRACLAIQKKAAAMLKPGTLPSDIYNSIIKDLDPALTNFMGYANRRVNFIGHGIGLQVDEYPVISKGFDEPLLENMTIALEPKNGMTGVGLLGSEDTYVVTATGGKCMTGGEKDIFIV